MWLIITRAKLLTNGNQDTSFLGTLGGAYRCQMRIRCGRPPQSAAGPNKVQPNRRMRGQIDIFGGICTETGKKWRYAAQMELRMDNGRTDGEVECVIGYTRVYRSFHWFGDCSAHV